MYWILRRTGAANFFNSLNNNCSTSKGSNSNNSTQDKYVKRPPRKAYGRLSADSDDASSMKHKIDDPFDDLDNFEVIEPGNANGNRNAKQTNRRNVAAMLHGNSSRATGDDGGGGGGGAINANGVCGTDCQGNCVDSDLCDLDRTGGGPAAMSTPAAAATATGPGTGSGLGAAVGSLFKSYSSSQKEINENTINRLQAMAMSDDDDDDDIDSLCCNVCDRAFHCHRQLASHQQKKRHFGCSACDSLFPSLMLLEHHKEEFEHWSEEEIRSRLCCRRNRGDDYFTDTDSFTSEAESEDLERLL